MLLSLLDNILYISGSVGVLWTGLWLLLAANNPASHPRITAVEKLYIIDSISQGKKNTVKKTNKHNLPIHYKLYYQHLLCFVVLYQHDFFSIYACLK